MIPIYIVVSSAAAFDALLTAGTIDGGEFFGRDSKTGRVVEMGTNSEAGEARCSLDGTKYGFRTTDETTIPYLEGLGLTCEGFSRDPVKMVDGALYPLLVDGKLPRRTVDGESVLDFRDSELPSAEGKFNGAEFVDPEKEGL